MTYIQAPLRRLVRSRAGERCEYCLFPSESAVDVAEKVQDYLQGGAHRVWCVYPQRRTIHVHSIDGPTRVLRRGDMLSDDDLLPGFAQPLNWNF